MVTVKFYANLRVITKKKEEEVVGVDEIGPLLEYLVGKYGSEFREMIYKGSTLYNNVIILVNGKNINYLSGLKTKLNEGEEVNIFPPVAGG
jgi:molybdopterin synthase sulfur carrier subunit